MKRTFNHLTLDQRIKMKEMLDAGAKKPEIAKALSVHNATIYREIDRGSSSGQYDPYYSDESYRHHLEEKGPKPILSLNPQTANYIAKLILEDKLSPAQIVEKMLENDDLDSIPKTAMTIYNAIDSGLIPGVTRASLRSDTTTVFNDGTIHIAKWVREQLSIDDGDELFFEVVENKLILCKKEL